VIAADRNGYQLAVLYVDIDKFKRVNDTLGHEIGDELLRQIALRLTQSLRKTDFIARMGGDEFTIIIDDPTHFNPEKAAQKIFAALDRDYLIGEYGIDYISASIGISIFPDHAREIETLLKKADQAMYDAKKNRDTAIVISR
jgi:diguanylate cyclase (GGDEF)-like protein